MKYSQASEVVNQLVAKLVEEHQAHYSAGIVARLEDSHAYALGYIGSMLAYAMVEDKDLAKQVKSALENRK